MFNWLFKGNAAKEAETQASPSISSTHAPDLPQRRRYRDDVPYALPKDLEEGQRLNLQHYIVRYMLRGNYAAPLPGTLSTILDVGSGTGIWAYEMAQMFPSARVIGLDLEPPQTVSLAASAAPAPANFHFVQGNLLQGLPFSERMFDYVHQRMMVLALPPETWLGVVGDLVRVTKPGGWVELLEVSDELFPIGPATRQLDAWLQSALRARGIDMNVVTRIGSLLQQAGLHSVSVSALEIPLGAWDRRIGLLLEKDLLAIFSAAKAGICQSGQATPEYFDYCVREAAQEWKQMQTTQHFYLAYGQV